MNETKIEWATVVHNFVRGCRRVSPGCGGAAGVGGCYAERQAIRHAGPGRPYEGLARMTKQGPRWTGEGRFLPNKLFEALSWRAPKDGDGSGRRPRSFTNSMSDLFFEAFSFEQIAAAFGVMACVADFDHLVLTKRADRALEFYRWLDAQSGNPLSTCLMAALDMEREHHLLSDSGPLHTKRCVDPDGPWPVSNIWLGVSAEDQQRADERVPLLLQCPAAVRFVSAEPLLGPIDFTHMDVERADLDGMYQINALTGRNSDMGRPCADVAKLDWVIVGGESGPGSRPCNVDWITSIVQQCRNAGVAPFVKQLGARFEDPANGIGGAACRPDPRLVQITNLKSRKGGDPSEWDPGLRIRMFPGEAWPSSEASL